MKVILIVVVAITVMFNSFGLKRSETPTTAKNPIVGEWRVLRIAGQECDEKDDRRVEFTETTMEVKNAMLKAEDATPQISQIIIEGNVIYLLSDIDRTQPSYYRISGNTMIIDHLDFPEALYCTRIR